MKRKKIFLALVPIILITVFMIGINNLYAQENTGSISDSFEDSSSLNNYEHSQDVVISGGVAKISPGNVMFALGSFNGPEISLKVRFEENSAVLIHYHASDSGSYGVEIINEGGNAQVNLFRDKNGQRSDMESAVSEGIKKNEWNSVIAGFSGSSHVVKINSETVIEAKDAESLSPGGIGFVSIGNKAIEIDDLSIKSSEGMEQIIVEGEEGQQQEGQEEEVPGQAENQQSGPAGQDTADTTASTDSSLESSGWKGFLNQLFMSGAAPLDMKTFLINLCLSALFSYLLGLVYIYWGASLSNRRKFASNFILLTVTTTFIILVVRSSVALSLGLVGALSIVRFRAAIKEPEELAYLFLAIGLGIGLGDNQRLITTIALAVAIAILGLLKLFRRSQADVNMHLNISLSAPGKITIDQVKQALKPFCSKLKLLRFDENDKMLELSFIVEFKTLNDLNSARDALVKLSGGINITFLDNKGIW